VVQADVVDPGAREGLWGQGQEGVSGSCMGCECSEGHYPGLWHGGPGRLVAVRSGEEHSALRTRAGGWLQAAMGCRADGEGAAAGRREQLLQAEVVPGCWQPECNATGPRDGGRESHQLLSA